MIERCSCGAMVWALRPSLVDRWRESHKHDMGDESGAHGQPGYVHESSAQVERGWPDWVPDLEARPPIGFRVS